MRSFRSKVGGSSLIEVMVSLFVFAIGILGVLSMQAQAVKLNSDAFLYSKANVLAMEMVENLMTSGAAESLNQISMASCTEDSLESCCGSYSADSSPDLGWEVANQWAEHLDEILPGGRGLIISRGQLQVSNEQGEGASGAATQVSSVEILVCFDSGLPNADGEFDVGFVNLTTAL